MSRERVTCAAEGCGSVVQRGQLMCKGHWFSLPKAMRDEVWRTWRAVQNNWRGKTGQEEQLRRIRAYRDAVLGAVEHLRGVRPTPAAAMVTVAIDADGGQISYIDGRLL